MTSGHEDTALHGTAGREGPGGRLSGWACASAGGEGTRRLGEVEGARFSR